jgi:hypothetical protein
VRHRNGGKPATFRARAFLVVRKAENEAMQESSVVAFRDGQ